ncbi:MAG: peptide ABC transporter substrate-binding protein [Chloroflexi bacterium]|nr:peptide ABC transporter substrate-binding protein [Chloroflexota bacterium]
MLKNTFRVSALAVILSMVVALLPTGFTFANDADVTLTSTMRQGEPITAYGTDSAEVSTLDPQLGTDNVSITAIENLFLGLTNVDPLVPGNILPELATEWTVSEDKLTWTFTLRNDVPWVRWDPINDTAEQLRMVTAGDVEYGIKRGCDPRVLAEYGYVVAGVVAGCGDTLGMDSAAFTDADTDLVQVTALDDTTLQITLAFAASYFLSQTTMWVYRPVPQETIEEFGDNWTEPGNIVTNGPFVVDELVRGVRRVYVRNPFIPADLVGPGNVERRVTTIVEDAGTIFALYQDNQVETSGVPSAELQSILQDPAYADQLRQISDPTVFYFAFAFDKPPFDDPNLRRAFSASIDRAAFIQEVLQGRGIPMIHFTPPGMFGAVPINEVGVGFDPEFARAQMAESGFPNCEGMPSMEIVTYASAAPWAEFLSASVERELGCDPNIMTIETQEFSVLLESVSYQNPPEERPNMWTLGWGPDYGDANNWVNDVLHCESTHNDMKRPCSEIDDQITAAMTELDQDKRLEMYYQIEEGFFGAEGQHPIIPLYMRLTYNLIKPWYTGPFETDGVFGGDHWDYYSLDQAAQSAARGG